MLRVLLRTPYTSTHDDGEIKPTATTAAKGVAKDALYLNAWWQGNLAVAVAVATNLDMAYLYSKNTINCLLVWP